MDRGDSIQEVLYHRPCGFGRHGLDHLLDPGGTGAAEQTGWKQVRVFLCYIGALSLLMKRKQSLEEDFGEHSRRDPQIAYAYQEGLRRSSVRFHGMVRLLSYV